MRGNYYTELLLQQHKPQHGEHPKHFNAKIKIASMLLEAGLIVAIEHPILDVTKYSKSGGKRWFKADILTQNHKPFLVEIDGKSHWGRIARAKDKWRDELIMEKLGWKTYRLNVFWVKDMTWKELITEFNLDKENTSV